jgi:hypothetical protein
MIEPVSRVQSYNPSKIGSPTQTGGGNSESTPFSMDQALAEESARDEGVFYDHSPKESTESKPKKAAQEKENDNIIEKPNAEAPLGAIDTGNLIKGIGKYLSGLWDKLLKVFGNIWESKPLTEGVKDEEKDEPETDPLHTEDSLNFHTSTIGSDSTIPEDDFDKAIDELAEESGEEHIKPFEDKAIRDALKSGDEERFEKIITRGGERHAAISSSLLTKYDAKGHIIQMDPSDENLILHGTGRTNRS